MRSGKRGDPWQGDGRGTTVGNGASSRWHLATTQHTTSPPTWWRALSARRASTVAACAHPAHAL
eukprot:5761363-Prorocentrum_lima.AAC.1